MEAGYHFHRSLWSAVQRIGGGGTEKSPYVCVCVCMYVYVCIHYDLWAKSELSLVLVQILTRNVFCILKWLRKSKG
jgi:hypothetical protein